MIDDPLLTALLLFAVGAVAGTLNVIAGGGSLLSLPVLIFLGLPPSVANGTNRVAILLQNVVASRAFKKREIVEPELLRLTVPAAVVGAIAGTGLALLLDEGAFQRTLAWLMVAITLWILFGRARLRARSERMKQTGSSSSAQGVRKPWLIAGFFVVGVYGGFVQAGVGFLILAVLTLADLDLVRGNAVKVATVLAFTVVSLAIFAWQGKVLWGVGLALALGNAVGGWMGVALTVRKGDRWIERIVVLAVLAFAVKLWIDA